MSKICLENEKVLFYCLDCGRSVSPDDEICVFCSSKRITKSTQLHQQGNNFTQEVNKYQTDPAFY